MGTQRAAGQGGQGRQVRYVWLLQQGQLALCLQHARWDFHHWRAQASPLQRPSALAALYSCCMAQPRSA